MDESRQDVEHALAADRRSAHDQADDLRRRIVNLAEQIARSEDTLADVYEESALLRPHAAERLREGARQARDYAAKERAFVRGEVGAPVSSEEEPGSDPAE